MGCDIDEASERSSELSALYFLNRARHNAAAGTAAVRDLRHVAHVQLVDSCDVTD